MSQVRALVVGASVAGPMTAYWLAKAGAKVTVIERFPALRTNGQAIDIRVAGVALMRMIPGMEDAVRAKRPPIDGVCWVRDNGQPYGSIKPTGNPDQQSLVSEFEIYRGDLAQIIFDLTKDNENVKYVFNEQVASMQHIENDDGPVSVEFANGFPTSEFDLVVACDGSTSRTRAIGLGCGVRQHVIPTNSWAAYFSTQKDYLKGSKIGHACSAVGGRFVAAGLDPSGVNRVVLMAVKPQGSNDATLPFREALKQGDDALKQFVAQHFKGSGWKTEEFLEEMMQSSDFYASEVLQVKTPSLYKGRFAMVGDAAYAPGFTGTGTTLAMTGGYILAGEISKHKGNLAAGLAGYEETMRPIVDDMSKPSPFILAIIAPQTAWGIWLRNNIFAVIAWTGIIEFASRYLGGAFASTEKYALPEYPWAA